MPTPLDKSPDEPALFRELEDARPGEDLEDQRVRASVAAGLFDEPAAPVQIDRFTLLGQLGSGGAGVVYAAYDPRLDRRVAIKVLHSETGGDDSEAAARLLREAQAAGRLSHPNVVAVFDVGRWRDRVYLAMDFAPGVDLQAWLSDGARSPATVIEVFVQAGRGLAAAHRAGIIHRDFKPSNVIVTEQAGEARRVRVVDFGLARVTSSAPSEDTTSGKPTSTDSPEDLTRTGQQMGTPAFMAPEQFDGRPARRALRSVQLFAWR